MYRFLLVSLLTGTLVACGGTDLSRSNAKTMLTETTDPLLEAFVFVDTSVPVATYGYDWVDHKGKTLVSNSDKTKLVSIQTPTVDVVSVDLPGRGRKVKVGALQDGQNVSANIEVTGITQNREGENTRFVEFSWSQEKLPPILSLTARSSGEGKAYFRLFDDGWRIESVTLSVPEEQSVVSDDVRKELGRMQENEAKRLAELNRLKQIEFEKREKRLLEALRETDIQYRVQEKNPWGFHKTGNQMHVLGVSSSHLYLEIGGEQREVIPFANVESIDIGPGNMHRGDIRYVKAKLYCFDFPHSKPIENRRAAQLITYVHKDEVDAALNTVRASLASWREKYPEFVGVDWYLPHYGKRCR